MSEPDTRARADEVADYGVVPDELVRMIENVADQLSEVAAQLVDVRKRLDAIEDGDDDVDGDLSDVIYSIQPTDTPLISALNQQALQDQQRAMSAYYSAGNVAQKATQAQSAMESAYYGAVPGALSIFRPDKSRILSGLAESSVRQATNLAPGETLMISGFQMHAHSPADVSETLSLLRPRIDLEELPHTGDAIVFRKRRL